MPDVTITRSEPIVVNKVGTNSFGDFTFTDKGGKEYKISNKRKAYFDKVVTPGVAVLLKYAVAYNKEYIHSAVPIEGELPPPVKPVETPTKTPIKNEIAPQEKGMWWKEIGEGFRAGLFKKDDGAAGSYLWQTYIKQMLASLEITIPKQEVKSAKSHLVEEAKKLGAVEIKEKGEH